jgi:hypothetical protein
LKQFNGLEMYRIKIYVYLWTNDRKNLLDIERVYPSLDHCSKCRNTLDNYYTGLSLFEDRFDNKGYYNVVTTYFQVEPEDDLNTQYYADDVILELSDTVYSINEENRYNNKDGDFVEFYTSTLVTIDLISKHS